MKRGSSKKKMMPSRASLMTAKKSTTGRHKLGKRKGGRY